MYETGKFWFWRINIRKMSTEFVVTRRRCLYSWKYLLTINAIVKRYTFESYSWFCIPFKKFKMILNAGGLHAEFTIVSHPKTGTTHLWISSQTAPADNRFRSRGIILRSRTFMYKYDRSAKDLNFTGCKFHVRKSHSSEYRQ